MHLKAHGKDLEERRQRLAMRLWVPKHPCRSSSLDPPFAPFPHSLLSRNGTHHAQHLLGSERFIELPSNCKRLGRGVYTTPQNRRANTLSRCRHEQPVNTSKRTLHVDEGAPQGIRSSQSLSSSVAPGVFPRKTSKVVSL